MDETGNEWKAKLWDSSSPRRPRWSKIEEFQMTEKVSKRFQIEHILSSILFLSLSFFLLIVSTSSHCFCFEMNKKLTNVASNFIAVYLCHALNNPLLLDQTRVLFSA